MRNKSTSKTIVSNRFFVDSLQNLSSCAPHCEPAKAKHQFPSKQCHFGGSKTRVKNSPDKDSPSLAQMMVHFRVPKYAGAVKTRQRTRAHLANAPAGNCDQAQRIKPGAMIT
ncbi:hypothetical protein Zmor_000706 [Zophobas morio]|uniref:Uncharacterized protein n=1 Tax=Zophobas morio TaxID=2755281 RepID=A0AA38MRN3_9CUCU|nr:hypothetical protein Zmor_000706 [Zophobas morio]